MGVAPPDRVMCTECPYTSVGCPLGRCERARKQILRFDLPARREGRMQAALRTLCAQVIAGRRVLLVCSSRKIEVVVRDRITTICGGTWPLGLRVTSTKRRLRSGEELIYYRVPLTW